MIQYFEHKKIDKRKWDATIAECGNIYAYSWYLDIVHPGWDALVEDDYQVVMPLTGGKKFGVNYLFHASGYAGGMTPLLDREGKPVVSAILNGSNSAR